MKFQNIKQSRQSSKKSSSPGPSGGGPADFRCTYHLAPRHEDQKPDSGELLLSCSEWERLVSEKLGSTQPETGSNSLFTTQFSMGKSS